MSYHITTAHDLPTHEALGSAYGQTYATEATAEAAMDSLDWDDDWGEQPELMVADGPWPR